MGYIIVFEGTDGSGKQVQSTKLFERLQKEGFNVIKHSFPTYESPTSTLVKMYLNGELCKEAKDLDAYKTSVLFSVDRLCTYQMKLKEFYEQGGIIVLDRYVQSNMLHQGGKIANLEERQKFIKWLEEFEFGYLGLPKPNQTIFLDMPPKFSQMLASSRKELKDQGEKDIQEQSSQHIIDSYNAGKQVANEQKWSVINCVKDEQIRTIEDIHSEVYKTIISNLNAYLVDIRKK